jgi:hypothetical protein
MKDVNELFRKNPGFIFMATIKEKRQLFGEKIDFLLVNIF